MDNGQVIAEGTLYELISKLNQKETIKVRKTAESSEIVDILKKYGRIVEQDFVYEFNNERNRTSIYNGIDNYLREIKSREGLYDYRVICDDTNNPPSVIDQNKLIVDIYVQPVKVAEFLLLQTTITNTSVDLSTIVSVAS